MPQLDAGCLFLGPRHRALLRELLARHVPKAEVWAFGSRVNGRAHQGSDLDLVLRNPQDLAQETEGRLDLYEALQQSALPMLVEVHDWTQLPAAFHEEIDRCYVVVQAQGGATADLGGHSRPSERATAS